MKLTGQVVDAASGQPIEARVQALTSGGQCAHPPDALLKVGPGLPFFYCDGTFEVDVPRGKTAILVERGTEYKPSSLTVEASAAGRMALDIPLERWTDLGARGWHPGNTHIHYDEKESVPMAGCGWILKSPTCGSLRSVSSGDGIFRMPATSIRRAC